ncbi:GNAT family N-acetyltransferase [Flavobacterium sp. SM15]|uniref:GNAT family N-acetyltransferase n=1 Tax=Flavobacterium sp. SM15 TaxID=2908005 RepID=UPI001EDC2F88|nr:GNAT family N-acetyltransferase [Flavobacterium sp. SM15]MCG2610572.1 GNAT family N-acetyltransferase [Flavobacterium sp. SM15]
MNLQPVLENETVKLIPLQESDFETLYHVASDPLIWEQHPNKDRYKREVFQNFFKGALESKGAFKIIDKTSEEVIGSTRFYDYNQPNKSILIGYTFYGRQYWGSTYNPEVKKLMLNYAFQFVDQVFFHIGAHNFRSQKAIERLGAVKTREIDVAYHGEPEKLNFEYLIEKHLWIIRTQLL